MSCLGVRPKILKNAEHLSKQLGGLNSKDMRSREFPKNKQFFFYYINFEPKNHKG